jgi:hypothetical protein
MDFYWFPTSVLFYFHFAQPKDTPLRFLALIQVPTLLLVVTCACKAQHGIDAVQQWWQLAMFHLMITFIPGTFTSEVAGTSKPLFKQSVWLYNHGSQIFRKKKKV